jgi:RHS repeat-associated protein
LSGAAKETGQDVAHERLFSPEITIDVAGYVYIFLSNEETTPIDVYFDDFKVTHVKSPVVQMDDYYPFGLAFNSFSRENSLKQDFKYNGKELQDELSLGWLDYGARMYLSDLARWGVLDPAADLMRRHSPYNYAFDNPTRFTDPDGMAPSDTTKRPTQSALMTGLDYLKSFGSGAIDRTGEILESLPIVQAGIAGTQAVEKASDGDLEGATDEVGGFFVRNNPVTAVKGLFQGVYEGYARPYQILDLAFSGDLNGAAQLYSNQIVDGAFALAMTKLATPSAKAPPRSSTTPAAKATTSLADDAIGLTTSSKSLAPSRTYTIFDGSGQLYKFGVTGANLVRYNQSLLQAGPGAYGRFSSIMPKMQAHMMEKYLRSLHYNSTGQYALPGMKVPYPVNLNTGIPIKP